MSAATLLLMAACQQQRRGGAVVLPAIDSEYGGGRVLYHFQVGDYGYELNKIIIIKMSSIGSRVWGCSGTSISSFTIVGMAYTNTANIVSGCADNHAAKLADEYNDGTYNDWALPTSDEFLIIQNNPTLFAPFTTARKWSSSQVDSTRSRALLRNGAFPINVRAKTESHEVIPIRYMIVT